MLLVLLKFLAVMSYHPPGAVHLNLTSHSQTVSSDFSLMTLCGGALLPSTRDGPKSKAPALTGLK